MDPVAGQDLQGRAREGTLSLRPFDKYYLVKKLAEGGMAEIFLAKLRGVDGFEKNVVVKRLLAHLSDMPEVIDMFRDEARLAAQLLHPNVVQIHELGFAEGCYFIAMEYLAGEDFSTLLRTSSKRREWVPIPVVLRVIIDAALGLHFAHEFCDAKGQPLGIVHRDISPSNLFITYSGQVKVVDFGIARAESRLATTTAGMVKGKYQYMSPEQASSGQVDRRTDIYALGVSLYEALTLRRAFSRDSDLAVLKAVMGNDYLPPLEVRPDLPPALAAAVVKAMAVDPKDRFQTAGEMAQVLEQYLVDSREALGNAALGEWLKGFFGPERTVEKTRIPSLSELKGMPLPALTPTSPLAGPRQSQSLPSLAVATKFLLTPTPATRPAIGRSPLVVLAVGILAGLAAAIATVKLLSPMLTTPSATAQDGRGAPIDTPALASGPDSGVPLAIKSNDTSSEPGVDAGLPAKVDTDPAPRPIRLTTPIIASVVRRSTGSISRCFESFKDNLSSDSGTVLVTITVARTGRVSRATTPLGDSAVGRCLEKQTRTLRFPAHVDEEVTVTIPFQYEVKR
jgi:serine/threonine protein kinase